MLDAIHPRHRIAARDLLFALYVLLEVFLVIQSRRLAALHAGEEDDAVQAPQDLSFVLFSTALRYQNGHQLLLILLWAFTPHFLQSISILGVVP